MKKMTQYDLVGATGCATGVAHTFMAEEALEKAAEKLGYSIKIGRASCRERV